MRDPRHRVPDLVDVSLNNDRNVTRVSEVLSSDRCLYHCRHPQCAQKHLIRAASKVGSTAGLRWYQRFDGNRNHSITRVSRHRRLRRRDSRRFFPGSGKDVDPSRRRSSLPCAQSLQNQAAANQGAILAEHQLGNENREPGPLILARDKLSGLHLGFAEHRANDRGL